MGANQNLNKRQLFVFFQFNGDNRCYCNLRCPECYGHKIRTGKHYWNGKVREWEKAFEKVDAQHGNSGIYFVFSYGEALVARGFYECVDMISKHPTWTLNIITNFMADPTRLLQSRLVWEKRLFLTCCWHPEGVSNPERDWETFKQHLLMAQTAGVPVHVMMVWFPPVIKRFPEYFKWLDSHGFRVGVRRYLEPTMPIRSKMLRRLLPKYYTGRYKLTEYTPAEKGFLYAYTCPKVTEYGLNLKSTYGKPCSAGKDMILVEHDGTVKLCADCCGPNDRLGNIFSKKFQLQTKLANCRSNLCGGDYGMLHFEDPQYGPLPKRLWDDTFISQVEDVPDNITPVPYHKRAEMLKYLEDLKRERSLC